MFRNLLRFLNILNSLLKSSKMVNSSQNTGFRNAISISSPFTFTGNCSCLLEDGCQGWSTVLPASQLLFSFFSKLFVLKNYTILSSDALFSNGLTISVYGSRDGKRFEILDKYSPGSYFRSAFFQREISNYKSYIIYRFEFICVPSGSIKKITLSGDLRDLLFSCGPDIHRSSRSFSLYNVEPIPSQSR